MFNTKQVILVASILFCTCMTGAEDNLMIHGWTRIIREHQLDSLTKMLFDTSVSRLYFDSTEPFHGCWWLRHYIEKNDTGGVQHFAAIIQSRVDERWWDNLGHNGDTTYCDYLSNGMKTPKRTIQRPIHLRMKPGDVLRVMGTPDTVMKDVSSFYPPNELWLYTSPAPRWEYVVFNEKGVVFAYIVH